jgi:hypothetical protein
VLFNQAFRGNGTGGGGFKAVVRWLDALMLNWIWGYGERPWRLFMTALAVIFAFGDLAVQPRRHPQCRLLGHGLLQRHHIPDDRLWRPVFRSVACRACFRCSEGIVGNHGHRDADRIRPPRRS